MFIFGIEAAHPSFRFRGPDIDWPKWDAVFLWVMKLLKGIYSGGRVKRWDFYFAPHSKNVGVGWDGVSQEPRAVEQ